MVDKLDMTLTVLALLTVILIFLWKSSNIDFFPETFTGMRLWVRNVKNLRVTELVMEIQGSKLQLTGRQWEQKLSTGN